MSYSPKHEPKTDSTAKRKASSDSRKKQNIGIVAVISVLAVVIVIALVVILGGKGNNAQQASPLYPDGVLPTSGERHDVDLIPGGGKDAALITGLWAMDTVTKYRFDGTGRGILYTAVDEYTFAYSAENGTLDIDLDIDRGSDTEYSYSINGDTLTLTRGSNTYNMTRVIE